MKVLPHQNPDRISMTKEKEIIRKWFNENKKSGFLYKKFLQRQREMIVQNGQHKKQKKQQVQSESEEDETEELQEEEEYFVHNWSPELEEDFFEPSYSPMVSYSKFEYTWHEGPFVEE